MSVCVCVYVCVHAHVCTCKVACGKVHVLRSEDNLEWVMCGGQFVSLLLLHVF